MIPKSQIILLVFFSWIFSITFHDDLIPLTFNDELIDKPFLGGFNRPKIQWLDWDMDGDSDLFILDASGYIRYLENEGSTIDPDFHLKTSSFQDIFCGGWFYFGDFDGDGDIDLMTQNSENYNNISYHRNSNGIISYTYTLLDIDENNVISSQYMTPTFADIDADGDLDFFTGNMAGTLTYYENVGLSDNFPQWNFITDSWQDIYIVGATREDDRHGASAITFIDLDGDGDLDLSWGDYFQQSLYIIWNSGTSQLPIMDEVTNQYPPSDPISSAGQNMPTFADLDGDGDEDLYITVLSGAYGNQLIDNFYYFENIGSATSPVYNYVTNNYFSTIDIFSYSMPKLVDIDMDGDLDLFLANQYDLSSTPWIGKIYFFRNTGSSSNPIYEEEDTSLLEENMGQMLSVEFGDLDDDGYFDLLVGDFNGFIKYFKNESAGSPGNYISFTFVENVPSNGVSIDLSGNSVPTLGDLDSDGDLDLLIGQVNGSLAFYRNIGDSSQYSFIEETFDVISMQSNSAPELMDIDSDGDLDLVVGSASEGLLFYNNLGTSSSFSFQLDADLAVPFIGVNSKPTMGHLFEEGTLDIIVGISTGGIYHIQLAVCPNVGDLNDDNAFNVLDIVALANCVLDQDCTDCTSDLNSDGNSNVLDIVALANCVLTQSCGR